MRVIYFHLVQEAISTQVEDTKRKFTLRGEQYESQAMDEVRHIDVRARCDALRLQRRKPNAGNESTG